MSAVKRYNITVFFVPFTSFPRNTEKFTFRIQRLASGDKRKIYIFLICKKMIENTCIIYRKTEIIQRTLRCLKVRLNGSLKCVMEVLGSVTDTTVESAVFHVFLDVWKNSALRTSSIFMQLIKAKPANSKVTIKLKAEDAAIFSYIVTFIK